MWEGGHTAQMLGKGGNLRIPNGLGYCFWALEVLLLSWKIRLRVLALQASCPFYKG